jgi:NDP-mannose synthase
MKTAYDAIVMAGGRGTRLMPYTTVLPKALMPLGDAPVLEFLLRLLHQHGVRDVCLAVNHLHHLISSFFGDGASVGLRINYSVEHSPLGTCGPVAQVLDEMAPDFILLNGDIVTDIDLTEMRQHHRERNLAATIAVMRRTTQLEYGVLETDEKGLVTAIQEKPSLEHLVSMGIYMLHRDAVRAYLKAGQALDMPDLLSVMIADGYPVGAYLASCTWIDIGRPAEYEQAQRTFGARGSSQPVRD